MFFFAYHRPPFGWTARQTGTCWEIFYFLFTLFIYFLFKEQKISSAGCYFSAYHSRLFGRTVRQTGTCREIFYFSESRKGKLIKNSGGCYCFACHCSLFGRTTRQIGTCWEIFYFLMRNILFFDEKYFYKSVPVEKYFIFLNWQTENKKKFWWKSSLFSSIARQIGICWGILYFSELRNRYKKILWWMLFFFACHRLLFGRKKFLKKF